MEKSKAKRVLSVVSFVLSLFVFLFALSVFIISVSARTKDKPVELFGYSFAIVVTDSMEPEIKVGDFILVKICDIDDINVGDNVVFEGLSGSQYKGKRIVHSVIEVMDDGARALRTEGVKYGIPDPDLVTEENFVGKEVFISTALGKIVSFLQQPMNWLFIAIIVIVVPVAVVQIIKIVRIARNKNKQPADDNDGGGA